VPGKALKNPSLKLPVVVYLFGGGFVFGSKDSLQPELPYYDGSGMIGQSSGNMIFVSINYRLGAYGWLAGTTMEKDGLPNAGLWDQRAAFEWVQKYISLVGGDPNKVTAMGESAGAGSLMHHLVAQGGKLKPLFSRAILLSPAYQWMWDRAGGLEDTFQTFAALAGCKGQGLACLRKADAGVLDKANTALVDTVPPGSFAVGASVDGSLIRQLPVLEFSTGNFIDIESVILSHCADEARLFVPGSISTDAQLDAFIDSVFPNYTRAAGINQKLIAFYPPAAAKTAFKSVAARTEAFVRDGFFTCNVRHMNEGLGDARVWSMQYSVTPGTHATDLVTTFYNPRFTPNSFLLAAAGLLVPIIGPLLAGISAAMQSYFVSYVMTGDPNTNRKVWNVPPTTQWNHPVSGGEKISGVVDIGNLGFWSVADETNLKTNCDFWRNIAAAATAAGGYAPPGAVLDQSLVAVTGDVSRNFRGGNAG
jgi:carboxylesterase type B